MQEASGKSSHKIGIMGGTFNPIHIGHLLLSERAYEQFDLEKVYVMPTNNPPHKMDTKIESDLHRCAMVQLAIESNPHFELSLLEVNRKGLTFTVDTLRELQSQYPDKEWYFIVGGDSLEYMDKWRSPEIIFSMATIVVAIRDEYDEEALQEKIKHLQELYHAKIELISMPNIEISSTDIRQRLSHGLSCKYLVPERVEAYISRHQLYSVVE